jgi:uncharacterized membrane protein YdjX (TVP38/TMEM64 family)
MGIDFDGIAQLGGSAAITVVAFLIIQALLKAWQEDRVDKREVLTRIEAKVDRLLNLWE